jgi:hypothetical protein
VFGDDRKRRLADVVTEALCRALRGGIVPIRDSVLLAILIKRLGGKVEISDEEITRFDINGVHIARYDDIARSMTVIELRRIKYMKGAVEETEQLPLTHRVHKAITAEVIKDD